MIVKMGRHNNQMAEYWKYWKYETHHLNNTLKTAREYSLWSNQFPRFF